MAAQAIQACTMTPPQSQATAPPSSLSDSPAAAVSEISTSGDQTKSQALPSSGTQTGLASSPEFAAATSQRTTTKMTPAGLLGGWLLRGLKAGASTPPDGAIITPEPETPTWSEASEASGSDTQPDSEEPASVHGRFKATGPQTDKGPGLTSRFGGWLSGMVGGQGRIKSPQQPFEKALGSLFGDVKTGLQKLAGNDRLINAQEGQVRMEIAALEARGEARSSLLSTWCSLIHPPPCCHAHPLGSLHAPAVQSSTCGAGQLSNSKTDPDWQQLPHPPTAHTNSEGPLNAFPHQSKAVTPGGEVALSRSCTGIGEPMFLDLDTQPHQALTFREVFLRSRALENLIAGYTEQAPSSQAERATLLHLLDLCLWGDAELHLRLVHALEGLSQQPLPPSLLPVVNPPMLPPGGSPGLHTRSVPATAAAAVAGLKLQGEAERMENRMAAVERDIAAAAAEAAEKHKFNSGAAEPVGATSPARLASGLAATAEVMNQAGRLCELALQRAAVLMSDRGPPYRQMLETMQSRQETLWDAATQFDDQIGALQQQKADGEAFRGKKGEEMQEALQGVHGEVAALEKEEAELLAQLARVQASLSAARACKADMEERRGVLEEGSAFTLEALQHQMDELAGKQRQQRAEAAALAGCGRVVGVAQAGRSDAALHDKRVAEQSLLACRTEFLHAATRHCYFQRAEMQLLLRQLRFCAAELADAVAKQDQAAEIGMSALREDMCAAKRGLQGTYLDLEAQALKRILAIHGLRPAILRTCRAASPACPTGGGGTEAGGVKEAELNEELEGLLADMQGLTAVFDGLTRPGCLPPPGRTLSADQADAREASDSSDDISVAADGVPSPRATKTPAPPSGAPPSSSDMNSSDQHCQPTGHIGDMHGTPQSHDVSSASPKIHAAAAAEESKTTPPPTYSAATLGLPSNNESSQEPIWLQQSA
ncbi:hypothetical protein WJX74_000568 [Apatococcus lobatus]|uniref:Uncharacterized protein n=1 Tax=Apatococcus lobatus TaxID=904363 RepID=A0AAW1QY64_9CHLO